jgi:tRNA1Val (adenine37-N6)-methyltransferase
MLLLLRKNVENNHLQHRVEILEADVKEIDKKLKPQSVNCVVLNPPFYPKQSPTENNPYHTETYGKLEDFLRASAYILKDGGFINLLIPSFRLLEACDIMENLNIKPAYLKFFHSFIDKQAKLVRIVGAKNLNPKLVVESPLIINQQRKLNTHKRYGKFWRGFCDIINTL